jgi:glucose-6-phosphate isomerase
MFAFVDRVLNHQQCGFDQQPFTDIVNIGVGGSSLGPELVASALAPSSNRFNLHFIAGVDGQVLSALLPRLNPATTLFIIASKSFTSQDTLSNAQMALAWFKGQVPDANAWRQHFIAVSANETAMAEFGILAEQRFHLWDSIGGRYSVWSAIGISAALSLGTSQFSAFLRGAARVDQHFKNTPLSENIPVLLALIDIWYNNFFHYQTRAILPYNIRYAKLPAYIQQLSMESCGKATNAHGETVDYATGQIYWGDVGFLGQHAFFQLLHQGTRIIPVDFLIILDQHPGASQHTQAAATHALAQAHALMQGKTAADAHQTYLGNRPSTTFFIPDNSAENLGALLALYEHRIFSACAIWEINAFDQWGVDYGKSLATTFTQHRSGDNNPLATLDASTQGLWQLLQKYT